MGSIAIGTNTRGNGRVKSTINFWHCFVLWYRGHADTCHDYEMVSTYMFMEEHYH